MKGKTMLNGFAERGQSLETSLELLYVSMTKAAKSMLEDLSLDSGGMGIDDRDIPGGEDPFEDATIDDVREMLATGESLSSTPWGDNASSNRMFYTVDTGHSYSVKPKTDSKESGGVERVEGFLKSWLEENDWASRQGEVSLRLDKHGECLDLLYYDEDGMLRTSFVEPSDLDEDPNSPFFKDEESDRPYIDNLGVRRTNDIRNLPVAFFVDGGGKGQWIGDLRFGTKSGMIGNWQANSPNLRCLVNCRRRNVLSVDPRGLTFFWNVRQELKWSKTLLSNLMRISSFQASFGAIRTISQAVGPDAVKSFLATSQSGSKDSTPEQMGFPAPSIVTIPSTVQYEFPETGAGQSNHIEVLVQLLRACASGMKLPEFMLTANVSEGNFASTLVSEGPFHKAMRRSQDQMVREDRMIINQALLYAAQSGNFDLSVSDVQSVNVEVKPPRVQTRNRMEDFEIGYKLWEASLLDGKQLMAQEGFEFDHSQPQVRVERSAEVPPPMIAKVPVTGPAPDPKGDPMKEKGVMKKDPTKIA
jgi:hypothetical protein